jgi:hypothetical protein
MSQEIHGFSVQLDDLEGFRNGVVDFEKNYELIVNQLTGADLRQGPDKLTNVLGFSPGSHGHSGKAGEFADSCEKFVGKYADLMHLLLQVNTAIKGALGQTATNLTATRDSYAELDSDKAGTFHGVLNAMTSEGGAG